MESRGQSIGITGMINPGNLKSKSVLNNAKANLDQNTGNDCYIETFKTSNPALPYKSINPFPYSPPTKEKLAYQRTEDFSVFSIHNNYTRPTKEFDWHVGESSRNLYDGIEIPPGSVEYFSSYNSLPINARPPFILPNPRKSMNFLKDCFDNFSCYPNYNGKMWRLNNSNISRHQRLYTRNCCNKSQDLQELERMMWFDPEPRLEKSYRIFADPKYCTKGISISKFQDLMRTGW